jgi:phosphoribosylformimino-5-aminoimidazole carboxamide ribotide isomerase
VLEIIPSIDLRGGKVVRLKQGDYAQQLNYDVDPIATARSFAEAGAKWMHVVDLDGAKEGSPQQVDLIARIISSVKINVEVGGGVRSTEDVRRLVHAGAARVVVGTKAIEDWAWFDQLVHARGMEDRIILALDAKDGMVATRGWTETSDRRATNVATQVSDWPLGAILYTDVAKDGMMKGPNFEQTRAMAQAGKVRVIASGGVGNIEHIRQLTTIGAWGAIVGRSLYEGTVDLREAIALVRHSR